MICAVVASGLPQPVSWVAFTARTAWIHHLLRPPVTAPPHLPLGTQNEVPVRNVRKSPQQLIHAIPQTVQTGAKVVHVGSVNTPGRMVFQSDLAPFLAV